MRMIEMPFLQRKDMGIMQIEFNVLFSLLEMFIVYSHMYVKPDLD